jgi:hypothetical protein
LTGFWVICPSGRFVELVREFSLRQADDGVDNPHFKERIELLLLSGRVRHAELLAQMHDQLAAKKSL